MKKYVFSLLCFIVFVAVPVNAQDTPTNQPLSMASENVIISIEGMACQEGCADVISANLKKIEGVRIARVMFESGKANIVYYPSKVSLDSLKTTITSTKVKDYSYTITNVKTIINN